MVGQPKKHGPHTLRVNLGRVVKWPLFDLFTFDFQTLEATEKKATLLECSFHGVRVAVGIIFGF